MKTEEAKTLAETLKELSESYGDLLQTMTDTTKEVKAAKKLWRKGHNPFLIKLGLALIVFPDPTISDILGAALVAAGTVQMGIRKRTLYAEDIYKTFNTTFRDMLNFRENL